MRWKGTEQLRGAIVVPTGDLYKTKPQLQAPPKRPQPGPALPTEQPRNRLQEARDEYEDLRRYNRRHYQNGSLHGAMRADLKASIFAEVFDLMGVTRAEMMHRPSTGRVTMRVSHARALVLWGLRHLLGMSNTGLAAFTGLDRSSIHHAIKLTVLSYPELTEELSRRCLP